MATNAGIAEGREAQRVLYKAVAKYGKPDLRKSILQMVGTFIPYFLLWGLMILAIKQGFSFWITLVLIVCAGCLLVRIFIFFHDCCHGSFFESRRANRIVGYVTGILTFTPFEQWRHSHAVHHATVGDLDRRGMGDVYTMTVDEYQALPWFKRIAYRVYRNPFIMFGLGPASIFFVGHRFPHRRAKKPELLSVIYTNLAILAIIVVATLTVGLSTYLLIQVPVMLVAGTMGVWLFYVQHQYDGVYWARHDAWDPMKAALEGSSFYKLPKVLRWVTGNIGFHHVHHVQPRIPNYRLRTAWQEIPQLQAVEPLTIRKSLNSLHLNLWDEKKQKLVGFRSLSSVRQ